MAILTPLLLTERDIRSTFYQQLKEEGCLTPCLNRLTRRHYVSGETICAELKDLDGQAKGLFCFAIERYVGSGFAGQVYQARPQSLEWDESHPWVALKVLRPRPRWKELFRDTLFRLSFQSPFAPRIREPALRAGLIWQALLRLAANTTLNQADLIPQPLGYYWDADLLSFVEVQEWVEGRVVRYQFDEDLLLRWLGWPRACPSNEMQRKKAVMAQLVDLCHRLGAIGLARQYEWYTLVSQANVLVRRNRADEKQSEFIAVDWRPGLAVPFFLPLSPVHARLIWDGLWQGQWVHFDEVALDRLETYGQTQNEVMAPLQPLIARLKADEVQYRAGLLSLWPTRPRSATNYPLVQAATLDEWQKRDLISPAQAVVWQKRRGCFWFYFWLEFVPVVGQLLVRWLGNEQVRTHWRQFLTQPDYRQKVYRVYRARALLRWVDDGRVPLAHAAALRQSLPRYWLEALSLGWWPRGAHRLVVDAAARRQWLITHLIMPARYIFWSKHRIAWLIALIQHESEQGLFPPEKTSRLLEQMAAPRMAEFSRDLVLTVALEFWAKLFYALLAVYGATEANWLPFVLALLGPISPSGVVRVAYLLGQVGYDLPHIIGQRDGRLLLARLSGLCVAPWRVLGNFCVPLEIAIYYPEMALCLSSYLVTQLAKPIPVLGGRGSLLEYSLFMWVSNLPVALQRTLVTILKTKKTR